MTPLSDGSRGASFDAFAAFALREMNRVQQGALIVGGILAVLPGQVNFLIGVGLILLSLAWQYLTMPKAV